MAPRLNDRGTYCAGTLTLLIDFNQIFFEAGCKVSFNREECRGFYNKKLVMVGKRNVEKGLGHLPVNPVGAPNKVPPLCHLNLSMTPSEVTHCATNSIFVLSITSQDPHNIIVHPFIYPCIRPNIKTSINPSIHTSNQTIHPSNQKQNPSINQSIHPFFHYADLVRSA